MSNLLVRRLCPFLLISTVLCISARVIADPPLIDEAPCPASPGEGITAGPDDTIWFAVRGKIVCMNDKGLYRAFDLPAGGPMGNQIIGMAAGPDGNIWFAQLYNNAIGRVTPQGQFTIFPVPTKDARPWAITAGTDGNVWFTEREGNKIGKITPTGEITEYDLRTPKAFAEGITASSDGSIWFADGNDKIGRISPTGEVIELKGMRPCSGLTDLKFTKDGSLWVALCGNHGIWRISSKGEIKEFTTPKVEPFQLAPDKDGNIWFTDMIPKNNHICRMTFDGQITYYKTPTRDGHPFGVTTGKDDNIWFTEWPGNKIGKVNLKLLDGAK